MFKINIEKYTKIEKKKSPKIRVFSPWFGSRLVVVASSQSVVQECFTKHDIALANRPTFCLASISATTKTLSFTPATASTGAISAASCRWRLSQCTVWTPPTISEETSSCRSSFTCRATTSLKWISKPCEFL